jgi:8-amino-7-oxononanoate synthase
VRLRERAAYLRHALRGAGIDVAEGRSHIVPVHIGPNDAAVAVAAAMQAEGFDVRAIRPPTVPTGTARLRVSVNVGLDERTLGNFARLLSSALREAGVCSAASS